VGGDGGGERKKRMSVVVGGGRVSGCVFTVVVFGSNLGISVLSGYSWSITALLYDPQSERGQQIRANQSSEG
jgi:hypothetical protein